MTASCPQASRGSFLVGIDLVPVPEVTEAIRIHGQRYLGRVFTQQELLDCREDARLLAARFAAKEATIKALRGGRPLGWRSIAVHSGAGAAWLELTGAAAELAQEQRVCRWSLSLYHGRDRGAALVLGQVQS